ncbi:DUF1799 domain-containing protein [Pseudomonas tolaasii]
MADNWDAFKVFEAMSTQWRTDACGATGMDYSALVGVIRMCGVPISQRQTIFSDFRRMEAGYSRSYYGKRGLTAELLSGPGRIKLSASDLPITSAV